MKDDKLYLIHILECIERVQQYTKEGRVYFFADTKTQDAVIRLRHHPKGCWGISYKGLELLTLTSSDMYR